MRIKTNLEVFAGPMPLAPLVDVVFLLLIFFMMSSSLVFWPGTRVDTKVQLPSAHTSSMSAADKLIITITRSDLLFFNDEKVEWDDLERRLNEAVRRSKLATARQKALPQSAIERLRTPLVVLRADKSIPYEQVIEVMTLARSLNLGVYLATAMPQKERQNVPGLSGDKVE